MKQKKTFNNFWRYFLTAFLAITIAEILQILIPALAKPMWVNLLTFLLVYFLVSTTITVIVTRMNRKK
ncbi:hypothetical protein [Fructobacillus durionis]|uniref:Uncharacterized protein n=1 Tax=Fructobacillus durionis TaxID=283737 RepID=A0A1I1H4C0_9LACO|nr:hypothetical protein [Fructobacillus durionis]SFC16030.1 hypothetical protein SAMN05660453_1214 [Fructobacillus durionis]